LRYRAQPHPLWMNLKSVTHAQRDARPAVTFPAVWYNCALAGTSLYCLVTDVRVCVSNLSKVVMKAERPVDESATFKSSAVTLHHQATPHLEELSKITFLIL